MQQNYSSLNKNFCCIKGTCHGRNVTVMTSHLESLKSESKTRMEQVEEVIITFKY